MFLSSITYGAAKKVPSEMAGVSFVQLCRQLKEQVLKP